MNKVNEEYQPKSIIEATEYIISILRHTIIVEEQQGKSTSLFQDMELELFTSLLVFHNTKSDELFKYHVYRVQYFGEKILNHIT